MLRHIIETARARGMSRLSLETGASEYSAGANALQEPRRFLECAPFAGYVVDVNSIFMTLELRK